MKPNTNKSSKTGVPSTGLSLCSPDEGLPRLPGLDPPRYGRLLLRVCFEWSRSRWAPLRRPSSHDLVRGRWGTLGVSDGVLEGFGSPSSSCSFPGVSTLTPTLSSSSFVCLCLSPSKSRPVFSAVPRVGGAPSLPQSRLGVVQALGEILLY